MSMRPFLAKLLTPSALFIFISLGGASYVGCSSSDYKLACDETGHNCFWCDDNGCKPADPSVNSSSGSSSSGDGGGGAGSSSSSSSGSSSSSSSSSSGAPMCDPTTTTCGCGTPGDCPTDLMCIDGLCIVACNNSFECGAGRVCVNGNCEIGCSLQKPCEAGFSCNKGFCIPDPANPQCTMDKPCPTGETCAGTICQTSCTKNAECPPGEVCDGTTKGCIPNPSPIPSCGPSKPCPGTAQCGTGGYCQYGCATVTECKLIDSRYTACDQNICKTNEELNPQCSLDKPCPMGQDCVSNKCL